MNTITEWAEIPTFESEEDEARFWVENALDIKLINDSVHRFDSRESTSITLRFDPRLLARIKRLARGRFLNYQSMMKQWLSERLEEELKRQG